MVGQKSMGPQATCDDTRAAFVLHNLRDRRPVAGVN